ncbi:hypothetical protein DYI37_11415 [Fulvimarina endophytica]|uniref:DUF1834 family protein n=1 Tax=Fulvimarina endophytica TaxID=2293836 RepID=A0A371X304_9HYPH|nr:hypothetical protein [Fulvimarina endophytica]RFC63607.1 hypothetical protein DYI37_11415 [Fulvimarina endophytica]
MDLSTTPIRTIEPLLIERLRLVFTKQKFSLDRVPSVLTIKEFERIVRQTPFIGLAFLSVAPSRNSGRQMQAVMRWRLFLVVTATRDLRTRFSGDAQDVGLDPMTDAAAAALQGWSIDRIGDVAVTGIEAVYADGWADDATVVNQVDFEVSYSASSSMLRLADPGDFKRLAVSWPTAGAPDLTRSEIINVGGDDGADV